MNGYVVGEFYDFMNRLHYKHANIDLSTDFNLDRFQFVYDE